MKLSALLAPLIEAEAPHELIMRQILAYEAEQADALERRRASDRDRQARKRASHVTSRDVTVTASSRERVTRVEDKTSTTEIEPQTENNRKRATSSLVGFEDWYRLYPHKVQRGAAEKAWPKALALAGSLDALVEGLQRYLASKPPERAYQNPATWLRGKGWLDQPAEVQPQARGSPGEKIPQLADVFQFVGRQANGQKRDDSGSLRPALSHLPTIRSG